MSTVAEIAAPQAAADTQAEQHAASEVDNIARDLASGKFTKKTEPANDNADPAVATEGEEGAEGADEEEKPKVAAPDRLDVIENAAKKARAMAAKNRERLAQGEAAQRELVAAQREIAQERQRAQAEIQRIREQSQQEQADPYDALRTRGATDEQAIADLRRRGMPDDRIIALRLKYAAPETAVEKMQAQLAEERQARIALERRLVNKENAQARAAEEAGFFEEVAKNETLSSIPKRFILPMVMSLGKSLRDGSYDGTRYSEEEVSGLTHDQVVTLVEREFLSVRKNAKPANDNGAPIPQLTAKPTPKTLTQKLATTKLSAPTNYDDLSPEAQMKHLAKVARAQGIGAHRDEDD